MFNVKWDYPIKKAFISLIIATRGSKCENNLKEVMARDSFPIADFTFVPSSMSSGVILLERPYISFSSPLLPIIRWEITDAAVALFSVGCFPNFKSLGSIIREI